MSIIMYATLHDATPNTYYGQWPEGKALSPGPRTPSIAHDELASSAGFVTFGVPDQDFRENRSPPRWKFMSRPQRKSARLARWRSSDGHAARRQRPIKPSNQAAYRTASSVLAKALATGDSSAGSTASALSPAVWNSRCDPAMPKKFS